MKHFLFITLLLLLQISSFSQEVRQDSSNTPPVLHELADSLIQHGMAEKMFPGISMAILQDESLTFLNQGWAKIAEEIPVRSTTQFQLGSVGKLLTAIAVLQLVDEGKLDLQADIAAYLDDWDDGLEGVTLHCLLTHSCGINDINIGYLAKSKNSILNLEEYAKSANPGTFQAPGTDISYSNYSYMMAGLIVEKVAGMPFKEYVSTHIFQPLDMQASTLDFPFEYQKEEAYALGYLHRNEEFTEVSFSARHATPAGSLVSHSEDMGKFIRALFEREESLLSPRSWQLFYTQQFTNHELLNGYSYGLEQQNINGKVAWAKGGMLQGMLSNILIVPGEFALFSVVNTSDDVFGEYFFKGLFDATFPNRVPLQSSPSISVEKYAGEYRNNRYNHETAENMMSIFMGAFNVYTNQTADSLVVYHNGKFHAYAPLGEGIFQCVDLPYEYMIFEENEKGDVTKLYRNLNIGGLSVPTTYETTSWYNSPSFLNDSYGFIPLFLFSGILFFIISLTINLVKDKSFFRSDIMRRGLYFFLGALLLCYSVHTIFGLVYALRNVADFLPGYPLQFIIAKGFGYMMIPLWIGFSLFVGIGWRKAWGSGFGRIYLSLFAVAMLIHIIFLYYWDFL